MYKHYLDPAWNIPTHYLLKESQLGHLCTEWYLVVLSNCCSLFSWVTMVLWLTKILFLKHMYVSAYRWNDIISDVFFEKKWVCEVINERKTAVSSGVGGGDG